MTPVKSPERAAQGAPPRGPAGVSPRIPLEAIPANAPGACPVCGGRTLAPEGASSALLAVCDVLTVKTLETLGKAIIRQDRPRYRLFGNRPWHEAHTCWGARPELVDKMLARAWDVVPALLDTHGCCGVTSRQVTQLLDEYVRDLVAGGRKHSIGELAVRFEHDLALPVYLNEHPDGGR